MMPHSAAPAKPKSSIHRSASRPSSVRSPSASTPDFARDDEQKHFTLLMARANQAYSHGDTETLQRLVDDHREINATIAGEGATAELFRIMRQISHAECHIAT